MKLSKWSYFLAVFLKVLAVLYSAVLVISGIMILRGGEVSFNLIPYESSPLVMSTEYSLSADKVNTNVANGVGFFVALTGVILLVWVLWLASEAFKDFAKGKTPFSEQNAKRIKKMACLTLAYAFVPQLLYSALHTILIPGYYFSFSIGITFAIAIFLFILAEVFVYGRKLEESK